MTPLQGLKVLAGLQLLVGAALAVAVAVFGSPRLGASFAFGAGVMFANIVVLGWTWWRILTQKTIAWTLVVIVIKYAVLLGTIVYVSRTSWFSAMGAGLGITSFIVAALCTAVLSENNGKE